MEHPHRKTQTGIAAACLRFKGRVAAIGGQDG